LNPSKEVPALIYGDQVLAQSVAIMEFLEETYPDQNPILPKSPVDRAKVFSSSLIINSYSEVNNKR